MFKYAVSNWIYGDEELESTYRRLRRFGYDAVELVGEPERYDPARIDRLNREYGIEVSSILSWCLWPMEDRDLAHPDRETRKQAVNYICRNVDLAEAVGAPVVVVIPAPSGRPAPHRAPAEAEAWQQAAREEWELAVGSVRQAAQYAREKGVTVSVEPINRFETFLVNSTKQGLQFIKDVGLPNVKLHLDTFHMNIEDAHISKAIIEAGPFITSMHLSDSNRGAIGKGHMDFKDIIRALSKISYQGPLILEPLPLHPNPFVALKLDQFRSGWDRDVEESITRLRELEANC